MDRGDAPYTPPVDIPPGELTEVTGVLYVKPNGAGILVNTSLNAFSEPIVCSPRDAIRAFFGTGLDMLVMDRFVMWK